MFAELSQMQIQGQGGRSRTPSWSKRICTMEGGGQCLSEFSPQAFAFLAISLCFLYFKVYQ